MWEKEIYKEKRETILGHMRQWVEALLFCRMMNRARENQGKKWEDKSKNWKDDSRDWEKEREKLIEIARNKNKKKENCENSAVTKKNLYKFYKNEIKSPC